ncbi:DUF484 family protein [Polynucleobacter sp. HIN9]|uniref:DUF484 family protein n=1 Tax=Polynucleobacter sp. HIN9 TaxID=3047868 RepID=UPI0025738D5E|nr:DUF484 family protein [Polynucleobacter sp. HIN9]BEI41815.1 DUF484 family protein [Polynucleobacter sp. HIN9]
MSAPELSQDEQEALVAQWLKACPGFFERHAEVLQEVRLKDPNSDRAISLQERQMHLLRSQNQELNSRLNEMLRFGSRNDKTQVAMVAWLQKLIEAQDSQQVNSAIESGLSSVFEVEVCKVLPIDSAFEALLERPICQSFVKCPDVFKEKLAHLQADDDWQSVAILAIPLEQNRFAGLALLSKDGERFTEDMGVFYLRQIAGLAAAALRRVAG